MTDKQKIELLRAALNRVIQAADDGAWHSSNDCKAKGRENCLLCVRIETAKYILDTTNAVQINGD